VCLIPLPFPNRRCSVPYFFRSCHFGCISVNSNIGAVKTTIGLSKEKILRRCKTVNPILHANASVVYRDSTDQTNRWHNGMSRKSYGTTDTIVIVEGPVLRQDCR